MKAQSQKNSKEGRRSQVPSSVSAWDMPKIAAFFKNSNSLLSPAYEGGLHAPARLARIAPCNITVISGSDVDPLAGIDTSKYKHFTRYFNNFDGRYYVRYIDARTGKRRHLGRYRFIMMAHLGRELSRSEVVHHRNGKLTDDRLENLEILTVRDHTALHRRESLEQGLGWGWTRR